MKSFLVYGVWTIANFVFAAAKFTSPSPPFTLNYDMRMRCKEHLCRNGYSYQPYYRVDSEDLRKIKTDPDVTFEMHLAILASSNGHILLSAVQQPTSLDPVYEIVVGGGGNKFTELRRNLRQNGVRSVKTDGILSTTEYRAFYIKITEDGLIEFGREGDILPILSYHDVNPLTIRYFSFAAWPGVEVKFLYDCPNPNDKQSSVTPNSEVIEQHLSNSDSLKKTLLLYKDPSIPPAPQINVQLGVQINSIRYDAFESKLVTGISIVANWIDDSMAWYPTKFNDTKMVTFREGQIWNPKFFVFNSDGSTILNPKKSEPILMTYSGEATYHFQSQVVTWCVQYNVTLNRWPRNEYTCLIVIEPWEAHEEIRLNILPSNHSAQKFFTDTDEIIQNGWSVSTSKMIVNTTTWMEVYDITDDSYMIDRYLIFVYLKMQAPAYNIVFYTPLIALFTFVLMSFWTEPLTMTRVWFYISCTVIICMGLCYIDSLVPCHTVPSILILYVTVLAGILLALLLHVVLMSQMAERMCKSMFVQNLLTLQWFRSMFCLPLLKTVRIYETINENLSAPEDDDSDVGFVSKIGAVEEMQSDIVDYSEKKEIAEILDKTLFVAYTIVFSVMLALHF